MLRPLGSAHQHLQETLSGFCFLLRRVAALEDVHLVVEVGDGAVRYMVPHRLDPFAADLHLRPRLFGLRLLDLAVREECVHGDGCAGDT